MADAYATLANGGSHVPPTIINKVVFPDGSVRNFGNPPHKPVFSDGEAYAATSVLKGVITSGTGTAANYGCPAAGKTGTAENYENAWFVGYTPRMSTAVWVGYPQANIPMANGFGGTLAAPIWHDYMSTASGGYCGNFPTPTTPFSGTAYFGPHSSTGSSSTLPKTSHSGGSTTSNPYNNPSLFAAPPQPAPGAGGGNGGGTGKPGGGAGGNGAGGLNGGNGNGNGHGGGKKP
jgi:penicillin-binding protein 1A